MQIVFLITLFVLGACFGSFLCCQARRLHLKSKQHKSLGSRSVCMHCKKPLKWYDNIPVVSWLILKGKCHYCHKAIGAAELISEITTACAFVIVALGTNIQFNSMDTLKWISLIFALVFILIVIFLAIYDGLYGELPTIWLIIAIIFALIFTVFIFIQFPSHAGNQILNLFLSILIMGGVYLALYLISKGNWVGDGDWLLAAALAIVLAHPWLAILTLFLTNFIALLFALPHLKQSHKIHLGPFMVAAFIIVYSLSSFLLKII